MADNQLIDPQEPRSMRAPSEQVANVGNLLQLAIQSGIGADQLEKLVMLQEHVMAKQAKDDFFRAMAGFQAECPIIGKNRKAEIRSDKGAYSYGYADLAMVADTIKPLCDKYGFSYSFKQTFSDKDFVETICIVRHEGGHAEETSFSGPTESRSAMSAMQKAVAATTTARRLALVLAFGLSVGEDNDGRGNLPPVHENAPRSADAPRAQPRAQRQKPVTKEEVLQLHKEWCIANPGDQLPNAFPEFIFRTVGREFNPKATAEWTRDDLNRCFRALGIVEE